MRYRPSLLFLVLAVSIFGAGIADVLFTDVVPIRPYDQMIRWVPAFQNSFRDATPKVALGSIFTVVLVILFVSAFAVAIANQTTGITIAHQGFTGNLNVTKTPGLSGLDQVLPLVAIGIGMGFALDELGGIL